MERVKNFSSLPAWILLIYALVSSSELFNSWFSTTYEKYTWLFFFIWLTPLFFMLFSTQNFVVLNPKMIWIALFFLLFGSMGELNTFCYIGLAFTCAGFTPPGGHNYLWIPSAFAWMPAIGWLGSHYFFDSLFIVRLLLVSGGTATFFVSSYYQKLE